VGTKFNCGIVKSSEPNLMMKDKIKKNKTPGASERAPKKVKFLAPEDEEHMLYSEGSSFDMDSLDEFDFDDSDAEVEFWGRKLGISGSDDQQGKKRLRDEFERDGLGDDFIDLFDFMEKMPKKVKPIKNQTDKTTSSSTLNNEETTTEPPNTGKYLPPHMRKEFTVSDDGVLKKRSASSISLTGLLNRVSEGNLDSISTEIISMVSKQKVEPSVIAKSLVVTACDNPQISITLQATFAAVVCAVAVETAPSNRYSGAVLATLISSLQQTSMTRTRLNIIRFVAILYSLGLFGSEVILSLLRHLATIPNVDQEARLDSILTCLRFSGRVFKDTNRSKFNMILDELVRAPLVASPDNSSKKVEFLIKELKSISKSNFRAVDHLQTVCHWLTTRSATSKKAVKDVGEGSTLTVWKLPKSVENVQLVFVGAETVFQDISVIPKEWLDKTGSTDEAPQSATPSSSPPSLEELAVINRMTTETKKNAFMAIMGSVDADHAMIRMDQFDLLKGSKNIPSIVAVVINCALMESLFNTFYSDIIDRLCAERGMRKINLEQSTRKKFTFQFKSEFRRLIRSGELAQDKIQILSQMISRFVASSDVSIEDIF